MKTTALANEECSSAPRLYGRGTVRVSRRGPIMLTALSRKRVKNAFSDEMYLDLIDLLSDATEDEAVSAVVLTGDGSYFSSGADLNGGNFLPSEDGGSRSTAERPAGRFMLAMLRFNKVLAAAVNGPAVGIAVTLLLHCDLCYCSESATFWAPFTRLALVPEFCSSVTFVETMGLAKSNELLLLGKKIDGKTAVNWNICSKVIKAEGAGKDSDPFDWDSLASIVCREIRQCLFSLPRGKETSEVFVSMIRGARQCRLENVCREELTKLDERFDGGECLEAAIQLRFGKSKL